MSLRVLLLTASKYCGTRRFLEKVRQEQEQSRSFLRPLHIVTHGQKLTWLSQSIQSIYLMHHNHLWFLLNCLVPIYIELVMAVCSILFHSNNNYCIGRLEWVKRHLQVETNRPIPFENVLNILVSISHPLRYEGKGKLRVGLSWMEKRYEILKVSRLIFLMLTYLQKVTIKHI